MEYTVEYPSVIETWYHALIDSIQAWWLTKAGKEFKENDLLID